MTKKEKPSKVCIEEEVEQNLEVVDQVEGRGNGGGVGGGGESQEDGNHFHLEVVT